MIKIKNIENDNIYFDICNCNIDDIYLIDFDTKAT